MFIHLRQRAGAICVQIRRYRDPVFAVPLKIRAGLERHLDSAFGVTDDDALWWVTNRLPVSAICLVKTFIHHLSSFHSLKPLEP